MNDFTFILLSWHVGEKFKYKKKYPEPDFRK